MEVALGDERRFYRAASGGGLAGPKGFAWIPPGSFVMGSPEDEADRQPDEVQRVVVLSRGFWLSHHEVTQAQYESVMGVNPARFKGDAQRPVETVSWHEAVEYCRALTERERAAGTPAGGHGLSPAHGGRVGIRSACGHDGSEARRPRRDCMARGQLRRPDTPCHAKGPECVGTSRHDRQRLGMVRGLAGGLPGRNGDGSEGPGIGLQPRFPRGRMGKQHGVLPVCGPKLGPGSRELVQLPWVSPGLVGGIRCGRLAMGIAVLARRQLRCYRRAIGRS